MLGIMVGVVARLLAHLHAAKHRINAMKPQCSPQKEVSNAFWCNKLLLSACVQECILPYLACMHGIMAFAYNPSAGASEKSFNGI